MDSIRGESLRSRKNLSNLNATFATKNAAAGGTTRQRTDVMMSVPVFIFHFAVAMRATPAKTSGTMPAKMANIGVGPIIQLSTLRDISPRTGTER